MNSRENLAIKELSEMMGGTIPCAPIKFLDYLKMESKDPEKMLRNVFQFFHGMIRHYLGDGIDEYPDEENIGYRNYDSAKLFEDGFDDPFFADRLFTNRLIGLTDKLRGIQNRIMVFDGPPGSGKSTFLKNLLHKVEEYSKSREGRMFEVVWKLDKKKISDFSLIKTDNNSHTCPESEERVITPCPSHDHPILLIPPDFRRDFLVNLIQDKSFIKRMESEREYKWLFSEKACTVCSSIFDLLLERFGDVEKVLEMAYVRRYIFDRRFGQGITVFNPGDTSPKQLFFTNTDIQEAINKILGDSTAIKYIYSALANTNGGIYCLMDVKGENAERFIRLHNIVTDGKLKVSGLLEEDIATLFIAIMNPEDRKVTDSMASFRDRITVVKIPYVLVPDTEIKVYFSIAGKDVRKSFMPGLIKLFATAVISSRIKPGSESIKKWLGDIKKYRKYCDEEAMILKMSLYGGIIPNWLSEEDRKKFNRDTREAVVKESEMDGSFGFSGRDSIRLFNEFCNRFRKEGKLITIEDLLSFFKEYEGQKSTGYKMFGSSENKEVEPFVPIGFMDTILRIYNYQVKKQIRECLFNYNENQISRDITHYIVALSHDLDGTQVLCSYTQEKIELSESFMRRIEDHLLGVNIQEAVRRGSRNSFQKDYVSKTLQEMLTDNKDITETELYKSLKEQYIISLRKDVLEPLKNQNFRMALKSYGTDEFETYDRRTKEDIEFLLKNLEEKFEYTKEGAILICLYVIDNILSK